VSALRQHPLQEHVVGSGRSKNDRPSQERGPQKPKRPLEDSSTDRRGAAGSRRALIRVAAFAGIPIGATVAHAALARTSGYVPAHSASAMLALVLALTQTVGLGIRRWGTEHLRDREWKNKGLPRWCHAEIVSVFFLDIVASMNFAVDAGVYLLGGAYLFAWTWYLIVQFRIARIVGQRSRTYYVRRWPIGDLTVDEWLQGLAPRSWFWKAIRKLFARRKTWSVYAAIVNAVFSMLVLHNATAAARQFEKTHSGFSLFGLVDQARAEGLQRLSEGKLHAVGAAQTQSQNAPAPQSASEAPTWDELCAHVEPGSGAPVWAQKQLEDVFLGTNGPGAITAGCASTPKTLPGQPGFVYEVGYGGHGEIRSLAVVWRDHPSRDGILLGDAAIVGLKLMAVEGPIGASARTDAAVGDYYLITTNSGPWVLMRTTKNGRYVPVPPTVAHPLAQAMSSRNAWLWATLTRGNGLTRPSTFMISTSNGEVMKTVRWWPSSSVADATSHISAPLSRTLARVAASSVR
jgi:hypothetical protein